MLLQPVGDDAAPLGADGAGPRRRPDALLADRGYDHDKHRRLLWQRGTRPVIAERGVQHGSGLGIVRSVVERTISWLRGFRRLRTRWKRRDDILEAFLCLATCLITATTSRNHTVDLARQAWGNTHRRTACLGDDD
ncbi:transposase [Streptomyces sp. NPDC002250]|uniref:transposase n=1 Tax=Streptomyces sp. NPDC002250 TaxID=3364641 RepID=UPI0036B73EA8